MKVLYLCHRIPYPPDKGDKIRAFHELRAIAARHEVDLFTLADDPADLERQTPLRNFCRDVTVSRVHPRVARLRSLPYLLTRTPLTIPYFASADLHRKVRAALAQRSYDRIFVYCSAMFQYVDADSRIPVITDLVDVDSDKWAQYATFTKPPFSTVYHREAVALRRYERRVCEGSAAVIVTTGREAELVRGISSNAPVHVIPNGVDTAFFQRPSESSMDGTPVIGFTGDMSYFPNQEAVTFFARKVLPLVRESVPDARFLIVGRNPSREIQALAQIQGVEVTGFVPDIRPYLARMRVSVAPFSIAAGIQNKILEAMSCEVPVVATSRTAQGLTAAAAAAIEIADSAVEMASRVVRLLRDPVAARERGAACRRRVAEDYNWERSLERLLELLEMRETKASAAVTVAPGSNTGWK